MIYFSLTQVASAPTQVLSPKRLRPASNPLTLTTPANPSVVSALPPVILNNNYLLASQSQAAVANFQHHHHHHHPLAPFHHQAQLHQTLPLPLAAKSPALTQIKSIIASSPTATIPTQIPSFIATAAAQQQQIKSINTSSSFNSSTPATAVSTVIAISQPSSIVDSLTTSANNSAIVTTAAPLNTTTNALDAIKMDPVGQMGANPMQSHPLSQSMDSVNTASNEEEVRFFLEIIILTPLSAK